MKKIIPFIVILGAVALILFFPADGKKVPYTEFNSLLENGQIKSVIIRSDSLSFEKSDGTKLSTDNPSSPDFKSDLLMNGIEVKEDTNGLTYWFDIAFDILFLGLFVFGAYKIAGYYFKTFRVVRKTGVSFSDVAGMDNLKREMLFAVSVLKNPKDFKAKGIRETCGIILEGPPGNGKTFFARALAQEAGCNFIATRGADFQGALMGLGAFKVKMMFSKARSKKPCIVFIDEFDSIGERRNYAGTGIDKENNRIITTLLNEMDGFSKHSGVMVIAATNSFQSLDPALIRPGRFDMKFTIGNPDYSTRLQLVQLYLKDFPLTAELNVQKIATAFDGLSCAAIETIINLSRSAAQSSGSGCISGNLIVSSASRAGVKINQKSLAN